MLFATSLADCTKCLLATGFAVFDEAMRQALHKAEVCLATIVAADNTCKNRWHKTSRLSKEHDSYSILALQSRSSKPCKSFKSKLLCVVTNKDKSCVLTMTVSCNPLESPVMGCLLDLPSSGKPSGLLDWLWQIELGQQDPADQPDCLDPRCQPGKQPRNGERKKTILRNNAKSILIL